MKRIFATLLAFFTMLVLFGTPAQAAPYCGITWGSTAKVQTVSNLSDDYISNVRAGRHDCYDRLVIDLNSAKGFRGYDVRYGSVSQEGSGATVSLVGTDIRIIVPSVVYDKDYNTTYSPSNNNNIVNVAGYRTFRQVALAGSFEGQTTIGLGVRAKLPMRVSVLTGTGNSARIVIDVAHRW